MSDNRQLIEHWLSEGKISPEHAQQAFDEFAPSPARPDWLAFIKLLLLWSGLIACTTGVIFFFAYNWDALSKFHKFAIAELALAAIFIASYFFADNNRAKSALHCGIILLIGSLLALIGQIYQTGADPWQLFAYWSLFSLPIAVLGRSSALWIFWLILVNFALGLYFETHTHFGFIGLYNQQYILWFFTILNSAFGLLLELGHQRQWLRNRYAAQTAIVIAGYCASWLAIWALIDSDTLAEDLLFYLIWIAIIGFIYRIKQPDLLILSGVMCSLIISFNTWLITLLEFSPGEGMFLMVSLSIIASSSAAVVWLKNLHRSLNQAGGDHE